MNVLYLQSKKESKMAYFENDLVFYTSAIPKVDHFDGIISEVRVDLKSNAPVIYFLPEEFEQYPTIVLPFSEQFSVEEISIKYFKARGDINEIPIWIQTVTYLQGQQAKIYNIAPYFNKAFKNYSQMPLYIFDFSLIADSLDVCKRPIDYMSIIFETEAQVNDLPCIVLFYEQYLLAVLNEQVFCGEYSRIAFDNQTYMISGEFQCENFKVISCVLKFTSDNYEKISILASQIKDVNIINDIELSNSLKLLLNEPVSNCFMFDIVNGGILIDNQRIPLLSVKLSEVELFNNSKIVILETKNIYLYTYAPISIIESKLKEQNIAYEYETFEVNKLIEEICKFYNLCSDHLSESYQFFHNLFMLPENTLIINEHSEDNTSLIQCALYNEIHHIYIEQVNLSETNEQLLLQVVVEQRSSLQTINIQDSTVSEDFIFKLISSVSCKIELWLIELKDPSEDSIERIENACPHYDVACTFKTLQVNNFDEEVFNFFNKDKGGLLEQKLTFVAGKQLKSIKNESTELEI